MSTDKPPEPLVRDTRPIVGRDSGNLSIWLFVGGILILGIMLFNVLDARRRGLSAPTVRPRAADLRQLPASPPPLYVPPEPLLAVEPVVPIPPAATTVPPAARPALPPAQPPAQQPFLQPAPPPPVPLVSAPNRAGGSVLILDATTPEAIQVPTAPGAAVGAAGTAAIAATAGSSRARATQSRQRETTIQQGTLIPAVLETALDSTRPGQARALVSQDVRGYASKHVLIPRGSRLFGEYRADLAPGQNRALVQWTRLDRPDGVTIAIDSPAADTLGRAGIRGKVNSHFFERFGSAILQSSLDLGVSLAARSVGNGAVILGLPTGGFGGQSATQPQQIQPTLTVRQGAAISVFVARDLDFTAVERRR